MKMRTVETYPLTQLHHTRREVADQLRSQRRAGANVHTTDGHTPCAYPHAADPHRADVGIPHLHHQHLHLRVERLERELVTLRVGPQERQGNERRQRLSSLSLSAVAVIVESR
jgi:hypothetical protein